MKVKYPEIFLKIFNRVIGHEGGFQDNPNDAGNWTGGKVGVGELKGTKYGLAAHTYPDLDIKNITKEFAMAEYYNWFVRSKLAEFRSPMQYQLFDAAFNHGMKWANKFLQRAVGVDDDGIIGRITMKATKETPIDVLLFQYQAKRIRFFTKLSNFDEFGRGWMNRMAANLEYASEDLVAYESHTIC